MKTSLLALVALTAVRTDSRVSTCVEQSWARADAKIGDWKDGCVTAVNGGVTYRVYGPKDAIHGEIAERKGDWQVVNTERPSEPCSGRVFQLWIDHGKAPQGASVRYEIMCASERKGDADERNGEERAQERDRRLSAE